jgi:predicted esterase
MPLFRLPLFRLPLFRLPLFRLVRAFALIPGLVLSAQDAGMVLRTSVTYRTQRNNPQLTDGQRQQADQLAREAEQAGQAGKYGDAIRAYYHGLAVMRGASWTPALEFVSSLQPKLDHAIVAPGKPVTITLSPLYAASRADEVKVSASVFLAEKSLGPALPIDSSALPFTTRITVPQDAAGDYTLVLRFGADVPTKTIPVRVEDSAAAAQRLRDRVSKSANRSPTAEYALTLYDRADRGEVNPATYKFADEFARANEILDALETGRDPFAKKRGDLRKAYRSAVDQTLQPYRILIPEQYNAGKAAPLMIALHGMGGDENSMFDGYDGALKREAERVGFVVACPKGRDSASMYRGSAEQDVLDVLAEVRRDYKIDSNRIYLMGHSMGAYGTWSVAMAHPGIFAALGPISGGGSAAGMTKIAHIPQYVVHGDGDRTVPVANSRTMVEAGKKAGANIVYVEVPGGSHTSIAAPQFGAMLDFFAKQKKAAAE